MNQKLLEFIGRKLRPVEVAVFTKWVLRIRRKIYKVENNLFYIDPISDFGLKLQKDGCYEPVMTELIKKILTKGDTFVDIGANEGFFSVIASSIVGTAGKVISIEPQQRLWEVIIKNFEINDCINFQIIPFAISDREGSAVMNLYPSTNTGASSISEGFNFKTKFRILRKNIWGTLRIKIKRLDEIIKACNLGKIKLIKIDVEGFEYLVVHGSRKILQNKSIENFLIEIHPDAMRSMGHSPTQISKLFNEYGYQENVVSNNLLLFTLAVSTE